MEEKIMELLKNLELVNVEYENEGQKAILTFLDEERGEVRTVNSSLVRLTYLSTSVSTVVHRRTWLLLVLLSLS